MFLVNHSQNFYPLKCLSQKYRLEQLQRENSKIDRTNKPITSFFGGDQSPSRPPSDESKENDTPTKKADPKKSKHNITWYDKAKDEDLDVMYCRLCQKHNTKERYACKRLDNVNDHEQGEQHSQAITSAIKCLNFLLQHNIPYTDIFKHLSVGSNAKYTSHRMVDKFIDTMAEHVEDAVYTNIKSSPAYFIMADEPTDVSNRKPIDFSAKYIDVVTGELQTEFVKDVELPDGKAETIYDAAKDVIQTKLSLHNLVAFGSDGCNTMIGSKSGVATRLKDLKSNIININCHNHRLALAAKNSFEVIPLFRDIDDTPTHVFKHYHYSAVRTKSLEKIQKLLNDAEETKTIKNAVHTRWLSHLNAVTSLRDTYESVLVDLENATASGTDNRYRQATIRVVHVLCDVLKPVSQLALTFERNDVERSTIHPQLQSTLMTLGRLKEKEGVNTTKSSELIKKINVTWTPNELESVHTAEKKFIDGLVSNITTRLQNTEVIDKFTIFRKNIPNEVNNGFYGNVEIMYLAKHLKLDTSIAVNRMDLLTGPTATTKGLLKMEKTLGNIYSNILKISSAAAAVLPLSTAEVERMFSQVKRTITVLQNRTKVEKMNKFLILTQNNKYIDFQVITDKWMLKGNRRLIATKK
ncbi:hypothetical protein ACJMK2_003450 [Sinanodonta woodiana]|uniref:Zinc finger protein 862-like n=1 Tax=Sinanodonta woodiana TaxID=1069815 RepID=A0ABD3Y1G1_SINWO